MKVYKFHNETYNFDLEVFFYSNEEKALKKMLSFDIDRSDALESIQDDYATIFSDGNRALIAFNKKLLRGRSNAYAISVAQHESGHFRQLVLESIAEKVIHTDTEAYLRISDWAFLKVMSTKFFKKIIKEKE